MTAPGRQPVALVTGGMRGIGEAISRVLIDRGYRVIVADIDVSSGAPSEGSSALADVATCVACDVSDRASVTQAIGVIEGLTDRLDVLVNNAGIALPRRSEELTELDWNVVLNVNAGGMYRMSQASFGLLKAAERSSIVSISSINAHMGAPGRLAYSASKAAIEAMTRVLAVEWAPFGIRVNAVAPGHTDTEMARKLVALGVADFKARSERSVFGRYADPAEIGTTVAWLAGPDASFVTGQVVVVDGGFLINGRLGRDVLFE